MCMTAGSSVKGAGSFVATDTRRQRADMSRHDQGGKIVWTRSGWVTGVGSSDALDVALGAAKGAGAVSSLRERREQIASALAAQGYAPRREVHDESFLCLFVLDSSDPDRLEITNAGDSFETFENDHAVSLPRGLAPDWYPSRQATVFGDMRAAGADLAERIRAAAKHFAECAAVSDRMSDTMEIGYVIPTPDGPACGFLRGKAGEIASSEARDIFSRFASVPYDDGNYAMTAQDTSGLRGAADVVFGSTIKYTPNRHNESVSGRHTDVKTFGVSYDQIPETRVLPQMFTAPAAGNVVEFKAISVTVSGFTIRAVQTSGSTTAAKTADMAATLNGTPVAAGITIGAPSSVAYCNLADANTTSTTYKVYFDVNTTSKVGGGLTRITAYKNDGIASTVWTQVGQNTYDDGVNLTGEHIDFSAVLAVNWDVRVVVTYSGGTPSVNATVVADRVDYDVVTGGTTTDLTPVGSSVLVQAVEKS